MVADLGAGFVQGADGEIDTDARAIVTGVLAIFGMGNRTRGDVEEEFTAPKESEDAFVTTQLVAAGAGAGLGESDGVVEVASRVFDPAELVVERLHGFEFGGLGQKR